MAQFITVFEAYLRPIESSFSGYCTLLDCFKILHFNYPRFKYADVGKFTLNSECSQVITAKLRTIPDLELFLQTIIKKLFTHSPSVSAAFITEIEPRIQLIIILTLFIQELSKTGIFSRRFISFCLVNFKTTARLYEVILSCFCLADDGFIQAYNHFAFEGPEGVFSGLLGFLMLLCFESFTPTVSEFLHINLARVDEMLYHNPELSSFQPFCTLLKAILALNCRADQLAVEFLQQFLVSACEGHPLMVHLLSFMNLNDAPVSCRQVAISVIETFGSAEFLEENSRFFTSMKSYKVDYTILEEFLIQHSDQLESSDLNYILEIAIVNFEKEEFKQLLECIANRRIQSKFLKLLGSSENKK